MKRYNIKVEFEVDTDEPRETGKAIFEHVYLTFNNDGSIRVNGHVSFEEVTS